MTRTPLLLVGDGPQEPTGLGRIARDLAGLITSSDLPVDLVQVGGPTLPIWTRWRHVPMDATARQDDWGCQYIEAIWESLWGKTPGILWLVWDPSRLYAFADCQVPAQRWAYTPIDSTNRNGTISGPGRVAVEGFDRVLAYGRWASTVVRTIRPTAPYLPHGIALETFSEPASETEEAWVHEQLGPHRGRASRLIGCVATNQPRKDLALFFETLVQLQARGHNVHGWLHTDVLVKAWSVQQLVEDCGLQKKVTVSVGTLTDRQLAAFYQACSATVAPGLGEGFGYPIVESLASGVPVVHGDFGGGVELVPKIEWRFPVRAQRTESVYGLRRPVFYAEDVANAIERIWRWQAQVGEAVASAYCRGAVAHLGWQALWPRWQSWIRKGLEG